MGSRTFFLFGVVACLTCGACGKVFDGHQNRGELDGTWKVIESISDGHSVERAKDVKLIFTEATLVILSPDGTRKDECSITLYCDRRPKAIDISLIEDGAVARTSLGIYDLEGDSLRICHSEQPDAKERPTDFDASKGSGLVLIRLKRID